MQAVLDWMASPVTIVLMLCLVLATFHHMQLGLQVVIDDYVHVREHARRCCCCSRCAVLDGGAGAAGRSCSVSGTLGLLKEGRA